MKRRNIGRIMTAVCIILSVIFCMACVPSESKDNHTPIENIPSIEQPSLDPNTTVTPEPSDKNNEPEETPKDNNTTEPPKDENDPPEEQAPIHKHTLVYNKGIEPKCETAGIVEHWECSECHEVFGDSAGSITLENVSKESLGHDYGKFVLDKAPTCTKTGITSRHCSRCESVTDEKVLEMIEHKYTIEIIDPTCTDSGIKTYTCTECGYEETEEIDSLDHDCGEYVIDKEPTCTESGSMSKHCNRCNGKIDITEIPAVGHDMTDWEIKEQATCTDRGSETRTCKICNTIETRITEKTEHAFSNGLCSECGSAGEPTEGLVYELNADEQGYALTGIGNTTETEIVIASEYNGLPVTRIATNAFKGNTEITKVYIPSSVKEIEANAFKGCNKLAYACFGTTKGWRQTSKTGPTITLDLKYSANNAKALKTLYVSNLWVCV